MLPEGCGAVVSRASWIVPPLFELIQKLGIDCDAGDVSRVQHGHRTDSGVRGVRPRPCPGTPGRAAARTVPPFWARWKPATAPCGISRESSSRRIDFRPRQQSPVNHRRHCRGRARRDGCCRDLDSPRAAGLCPGPGRWHRHDDVAAGDHVTAVDDAYDRALAQALRRTTSGWFVSPGSCGCRRAAARRLSQSDSEHPSLVAAVVSRPRCPGAGGRARRRVSGATVHFVTAGLDDGPIVCKRRCR